MKIAIYQIDAFATRAFEGNPAAVCPLDAWLPDELMQSIAAENNLSETAFFVPEGEGFSIRWFTPSAEVALCGHATLASAFVLFNILGFTGDRIDFNSKSGILPVSRSGERLELDFPSQPPEPCDTPKEIIEAFGMTPRECLKAEDYVVIFQNAEQVQTASPNIDILRSLDSRGVIISAVSEEYDFVARFFAPNLGIAEDPVTGSAYTQLVPYWAKKTGKTVFHAKQVSSRGGELFCELVGDRVKITGRAMKYLEGSIEIDV
jgi:PhzF family phenazine biosynthesis protein